MDLDFNRTAIRQKSSNELVNAVVDTSIAASLAGAVLKTATPMQRREK